MEKSFEKGIVLDLKSLIDYSEGGVISRQLIKSAAGNITLFSFDKGEGLSEIQPRLMRWFRFWRERQKLL